MLAQVLFIACGLISLGLIFMVIGAINLRQPWGSLHWPTIAGRVISAQLVRTSEGERYLPLVRYTYTVDERTFTSTRISFHELDALASARPDPAEVVISHYPPGKTVSVHFDPTEPARAVLEPGPSLPAYFPFGIGGMFFVLGLIAGLYALI